MTFFVLLLNCCSFAVNVEFGGVWIHNTWPWSVIYGSRKKLFFLPSLEYSIQMGCLYQSIPQRIRDPCGRRHRKIVRARGGGGLQGNSVFWTEQGSCTCVLIELVKAFTPPMQVQARPNPSKGGRMAWNYKPWSCWQLIAAGRKRKFSLRV